MSQPTPSPSAPPLDPAPATGRLPVPILQGCGRWLLGVIGWLLTLTLSVALGLVALAGIAYFGFGFDLATPGQIRQSSADVVALQTQAGVLTTEVALLRTAESEQARQLASANERVGVLEAQATNFAKQATTLAAQHGTTVALAGELRANIAVAATIQAEGQQAQIFVAVVATTQADTAARVTELQRRTDRITRFLERLSDLAVDVAGESAAVPTSTPLATLAPPPADLVPVATPTATLTATP